MRMTALTIIFIVFMALGVPVSAGHFNAAYILSDKKQMTVTVTATATRPAPADNAALQTIILPFLEEIIAAFGERGFYESQVGPYALFRGDRRQSGFVDVALMEGRGLGEGEMKVCIQKNNQDVGCRVLGHDNHTEIIRWVVESAISIGI